MHLNSRKPGYLKPMAVLPAVIAGALMILISGCGDGASTSTAPTAVRTNTGLKPLTQDYVKEMAGYRYGEASLVRSATLAGEGTGQVIDIKVDRPELCHDGAVVGTMATFAQKMMAALFKYPEVSSVAITMYGIEEGVKSDDVALRVVVNRSSAQNIDWFQFSDLTMPTLATEYYIHPKIQSNFETEGGDPSGPRSQLTQTTATSPSP